VQAAGTSIAAAAKALKAKTAAVAIIGLSDLSDADKVKFSCKLNTVVHDCGAHFCTVAPSIMVR
jgi:hypothetical protein